MANVSFKRGLASALTATGFTPADGVFYLTTDTNRLYVGQGETLAELNRYILNVSTTSDLPTSPAKGDFVFVESGNMLLVCTNPSGTTISSIWTQVNPPDTNTDTSISSIDGMTVTPSESGVTVSFNIVQNTKNNINNTTTATTRIPVSFTIASSDLATANNVAVGMKATSISGGGAALATTGDGSSTSSSVNLKQGSNVSISADSSNNVTIAATDTTYSLSAASNKITLKNNNNSTTQNITLSAGNDAIVVSGADNTISVDHKAYATSAGTDTAQTLQHGGTFTVVSGVTTDKGHVTAYKTQTFTLPSDNNTTYSMEAVEADATAGTAAGFNLKSSGNTNSKIYVKGGTNISVTGDSANGALTISHDTISTAAKTSTAVTPAHGGSFTVIDKVTTSNGHVTEVYTKNVTLPSVTNTTNSSVSVSANSSGDLSVSVKDSAGATKTGTATGALYMTVNGTKVYNQGSISFYTKSEIDSKINGINAMRYIGTVGGTSATVTDLPTASVQIGDTYMVAVAGTYGTHSCDVGDLLIATGTEGSNGYITSATLNWTYVPSGDDTDTHYTLTVASNKITLRNSTANTDVASATIAAGTDITASTSSNTITIGHKAYTTTATAADAKTLQHGGTFDVVEAVTASNGHVTGYTKRTYTLPSDNNTTSTLSLASGHKIVNTESNSTTSSVEIATGNGYITLTDDTTNNKLTMTHKAYSTTLTSTAGTAQTLSHGGTFNVVTEVTRDSGGHLSGYTVTPITLPSDLNTTYTISAASNVITLKPNSGTSSSVTIKAGTAMSASTASNVITIGHAGVTCTPATSTASLTHGNTFTVVDSITVNSQGHVTAYNTKTCTLPSDNNTQYTLTDAVATSGRGAKITSTLTAKDGSASSSPSFTITTGGSLKVVADATNKAVTIDLEWGTF